MTIWLLIYALLNPMQSRMEVMLSVKVDVWVALSPEFIDCTLLHNKYCGHLVVDGILESSLRVTKEFVLFTDKYGYQEMIYSVLTGYKLFFH